MNKQVQVEPGYEPLFKVLVDALNQAQLGKGRKCHANDKPFLQQEIITEGRSLGLGGHVFQVRKKVREAMNCEDNDRAIEDLLGAMVYTAAMVLLRQEQMQVIAEDLGLGEVLTVDMPDIVIPDMEGIWDEEPHTCEAPAASSTMISGYEREDFESRN